MSITEKEREELLDTLKWDSKHFGEELATTAFARGLAVTGREDGVAKPIPITATPIIIDGTELARRQQLAQTLSAATLKMSRVVLADETLRDLVLNGLSPLEAQLARTTFEQLDTLINTRVDFFVGDKVNALEVNATIPAMQGYSDIAANTFIEVVGRHFGAPGHLLASWQAKNGSNTLALYRALLSGYSKVRPGREPERIALLVRRNDAQLTEQKYLLERFREFGAEVELLYPDELSGTDAVEAHGKKFDLIYRHLFVRRLEEPDMAGADYVKVLLAEPNGTRAVVLNPPASQVEVKAVFALLSQALDDGALRAAAKLNEAELAAIAEAVPWTRPFRGDSLLAKVKAAPDDFVLKRSWDYGGRAVFVGRTREEPGFHERTVAAYGEPLGWEALCERALADERGGGFVVQRLVELVPEEHILCTGPAQIPTQLFVDFSAYASVGIEQPRWGGVCRGSVSHIVNIVGGGGVIPLLTEEVAKALLQAKRAWGR